MGMAFLRTPVRSVLPFLPSFLLVFHVFAKMSLTDCSPLLLLFSPDPDPSGTSASGQLERLAEQPSTREAEPSPQPTTTAPTDPASQPHHQNRSSTTAAATTRHGTSSSRDDPPTKASTTAAPAPAAAAAATSPTSKPAARPTESQLPQRRNQPRLRWTLWRIRLGWSWSDGLLGSADGRVPQGLSSSWSTGSSAAEVALIESTT